MGTRPLPESLSRIILAVSLAGLAICLAIFFLANYLGRRLVSHAFGLLPAVAFWVGLPGSIALFVLGFFIESRKKSITTMLIAVAVGIVWFFVAFGSFAIAWYPN